MQAPNLYLIRFYKTVTNSYGSDIEICQRSAQIAAADRETAARRAIAGFCRAEGVRDWKDHADRYEVCAAALGVQPAPNHQGR
jgi:hypothetical protein